jgi:anthranilate synthase component I
MNRSGLNRSGRMNPVHATTTRDEFRALAAEHRVVPVTRKVLADSETPLSA